MRYLLLFLFLTAAVAAAAVLRATPSDSKDEGRRSARSSPGAPRALIRHGLPLLFAPSSVWNKPLEDDAALDPSSEEMVANLNREVAHEQAKDVGPWINTRKCSTPLYVVPAGRATVPVRLTHPRVFWRRSLARVFRRVPLPRGARPADCVDQHLTVWQPSADRLWEFFHLRREDGDWWADWGGAMEHVSRSPGYYAHGSWPGLSASNWGATATSLPVAAGVMLLDELRRGQVNHALALNVPMARAGVFSWPAQRSDGIGGAGTIPEGARLRLDPSLDLASLNLPPVTLTIARAVQRYGAIIRDQTGPGNGISFFAEDPRPVGSNPYDGPGGVFGGSPPDLLLSVFPWDRLQLLKMTLCTEAPCRRG